MLLSTAPRCRTTTRSNVAAPRHAVRRTERVDRSEWPLDRVRVEQDGTVPGLREAVPERERRGASNLDRRRANAVVRAERPRAVLRQRAGVDGRGRGIDAGFRAGNPTVVFHAPSLILDARLIANTGRASEVSGDGQRFLMLKDDAAAAAQGVRPGIVVVQNWFEELKARVPAAVRTR